jgi:hypothetical protein
MKHSELKQLIREEIQKTLKEEYTERDSLTVKELIQKLSSLPPYLLIGIYQDSSGDFIEIDEISIEEDETGEPKYAVLK